MRERVGIAPEEVEKLVPSLGGDELPLTVVPDWDDMVTKSNEMAKVIDRHLDYEAIYQGHDLNPAGLCPQQRVNLVSDLTAVV